MTPRGARAARRSPAITDVAKLAHVSHQTVSRVLNAHPNVTPLTRARVLAAIEQLGYRPNAAARALATGRSKTLGVVTLNTTLFGPVSTLYGIEQAARAAGYFLSVVSPQSIDRDSVRDAAGRLADQHVEGIVVIAPLVSATEALDGLPTNMPVVVVEGDPRVDLAAVTVDQVAGARAATTFLLSCGHRTVFHVAGPSEWQEAQGRVAGWLSALEGSGAEVTSALSGDWTARSGYRAGRSLAGVPEATAIFVANDQMALGVLLALHECHRRVPEDVSVIGFDDIPESAYFTPPLTTVRQDFDQVGRASLRLLLDQIESGARSVDRVMVPSELVVRRSTREGPGS
ncbi:MAG: LacI family DNA-binding transcriptional regulator [Acidimicrobiales bacterium]